MKNRIILVSTLLLVSILSSCETQPIQDETGIEEAFSTNKGDVIAPGEDEGTDEQ
ncbi:hypothetical protein [Aquimarina longa]|uniref:hypothetical protein n=1 Tax=Aquimarina longa TaxID=1080221 RepID=UPI00130EB8E8|nr:hypothetical protein [Aquimarina longa]